MSFDPAHFRRMIGLIAEHRESGDRRPLQEILDGGRCYLPTDDGLPMPSEFVPRACEATEVRAKRERKNRWNRESYARTPRCRSHTASYKRARYLINGILRELAT